MIRAGVRVAVSSDAPYGDPDPWRTITAATRRGAASVRARSVLATLLSRLDDPGGPPRSLDPGSPGDLCLLNRPYDAAVHALDAGRSVEVRATFIGGELSY